jgi:purine-nucleoside phosphorylase
MSPHTPPLRGPLPQKREGARSLPDPGADPVWGGPAPDRLTKLVAISATTLRQRLEGRAPTVAVLLGSGWWPLAQQVQDAVEVPYADLPAFPSLGQSVSGHVGLLRAGRIGAVQVVVLAGRQHAYETGQPDGMKGAIRTLAAIGVRVLVQTNAAGSLEPDLPPGELMLLSDHLNVVQRSPLVGETGDHRFVDMSNAYCPRLRVQARAAAQAAGTPLREGVYAWVLGPQFETPAEIRMLRTLGAQAVGMSTVPETIVARHAGLRVLALSLITNMAAGMSAETLSHAHTLATAGAASERAVHTLAAVLQALEI